MFDIVIAFDLKIKRSYVFSYDLDYYFKKKNNTAHKIRREKIINLYNIPQSREKQKTLKNLNGYQKLIKISI